MPTISVVMSVYKEPLDWINKSVSSILKQTFGDFEFLIVNDNPGNKELRDCLNKFCVLDPRVRVINNIVNIGLTKSLNKAIKESKGAYIARMDADDISLNDRFQCQLDNLTLNKSDICFSSYHRIDDEDRVFKTTISNYDVSYLFLRNIFAHPSAMWKSSLNELREPLYNESFRRSQDYELWSFFYLKDVKVSVVYKPLINYRLSKKQITNAHSGEQISDFKAIRRAFYISYLNSLGISVDDEKELRNPQTIRTIESKYYSFDVSVRRNLDKILYVLYYSSSKKYRYIFNGRLYILRINAFYSFYYFLNWIGLKNVVVFSL